ncbi:PIN-like domain-containing protein [Haloflavibacter putidus]|uniref:VapC45 PIN like domain-containing protein n=1 Tax=Haloflavibacter putidus TaxID=2576776 RepID=A0A507ZZ21_9FLAO|nr:hypothetical protein [Haloflavibacter putidus]TQD38832.1 hypothetical protein FKR84_07555 [Haloflavibacter putidus]
MTVYFDENIPPHLAKGFHLIQEKENLKNGRVPFSVKVLKDEFGQGTKDIDWIPQVGLDRNFVVTRDININKKKDERNAYREAGIGMFFIYGTSKNAGLSVWEILFILAKHWEAMIKIMLEDDKAFAYKLTAKGRPKKLP